MSPSSGKTSLPAAGFGLVAAGNVVPPEPGAACGKRFTGVFSTIECPGKRRPRRGRSKNPGEGTGGTPPSVPRTAGSRPGAEEARRDWSATRSRQEAS